MAAFELSGKEKMELFGLSTAELSSMCEGLGCPSYRGKQIAQWLYSKGAHSVDEMSNLPASLRDILKQSSSITRSEIIRESKSADNTTKYLLKLSDGETIESVLLPYSDRTSVCVSTQVGCLSGCTFCATADSGFVRNLTAGEIVDQVLTLQQKGKMRISHVVFMGMGEPLLNLDNVIKAIYLLNDEVGISMRRLTISTVGIIPAIKKLEALDMQLTLALSLHASDDDLRRKLIPLAKKYPLDELIKACSEYAEHTKRRITFEYLMLKDVNDSIQHAYALVKLIRGVMCHVNLIPYNEVDGKQYRKSDKESIAAFRHVLESSGIEVTQRMERGGSVSGACGQLRRRNA